ncbi:hypothetical protein FB451DRAFT_1180108 [Mycena latifolia]|nr:hypothetical protein FB451DRAFT_1180108 [Mycena latifolia]
MAARLPPAAKLSRCPQKCHVHISHSALAVRDEYESKKAGFDKELSDLLGVAWTFDFTPLAIYPYMEGALTWLRWVVEVYGEAGKKELNDVVSAHTIQLEVGEPEQIIRNSDLGADVVDGKLRILFAADRFGSNPHSALGELALFPALNATPSTQPMTFLAWPSISKNYHEKADPAQKKFATLLQKPNIKLDPSFEEVFGKLLEESQRPGNELVDIPEWQLQFGRYVANYFDAMAYQMESLGFGTDEMLREGFNEGVESGLIKFRIVDALKRQKDCEVEIEDSVLYLQTTLAKWGWNPNTIGYDISDLL